MPVAYGRISMDASAASTPCILTRAAIEVARCWDGTVAAHRPIEIQRLPTRYTRFAIRTMGNDTPLFNGTFKFSKAS
jgi:hypothetical protein